MKLAVETARFWRAEARTKVWMEREEGGDARRQESRIDSSSFSTECGKSKASKEQRKKPTTSQAPLEAVSSLHIANESRERGRCSESRSHRREVVQVDLFPGVDGRVCPTLK